MSYVAANDFLALLRSTSGGVRVERMPGLDFVVMALSRMGLIKLWVGETAPTEDQQNTVWFRPAAPSWSKEGQTFLWDVASGMYVPAAPELWSAVFIVYLDPAMLLNALNAVVPYLPDALPSVPNKLWNNRGVLCIS